MACGKPFRGHPSRQNYAAARFRAHAAPVEIAAEMKIPVQAVHSMLERTGCKARPSGARLDPPTKRWLDDEAATRGTTPARLRSALLIAVRRRGLIDDLVDGSAKPRG